MDFGGFRIEEPIPQLDNPHMFVTVRDWVNVGNVGSMALNYMGESFDSKKLGRIEKPGIYYDFTRYRPKRKKDGTLSVPNTSINYIKTPEKEDFILVDALEPHWDGEKFVESLLDLASYFGVKRYALIGGMYGSSPHTRPLKMSGRTTEKTIQQTFDTFGVQESKYGGTTTIMVLASERAAARGIDMMHLIVQLPPYVRVEEFYRGGETLLKVLNSIYKLDIDLEDVAVQADQQHIELNRIVEGNPQVRALLRQLEANYDYRADDIKDSSDTEEPTELSDELRQFINDIETGND